MTPGFVWIALADVPKGCRKYSLCFIGDGHPLITILTSNQGTCVNQEMFNSAQ